LRSKISKYYKKFSDNYRELEKRSKEEIISQKLESKRIKNSQPKLDLKSQILKRQWTFKCFQIFLLTIRVINQVKIIILTTC
jgi:hypothetical protein